MKLNVSFFKQLNRVLNDKKISLIPFTQYSPSPLGESPGGEVTFPFYPKNIL